MSLVKVRGQDSWVVSNGSVEAAVARLGAQVGPVRFRIGDRSIEPLAVAPWADSPPDDQPAVIRALRGDFFCMPFGHSEDLYLGERHPLHGEPANATWELENRTPERLDLVMECHVRHCRVHKTVFLLDSAVYQRHTVLGLEGPMSFGTHLMIHAESPGAIGLSPHRFAQVFPGDFEDPARGGYSSLQPGALIEDLRDAPLERGGTTNLLSFPDREGFEDLVMVGSDSTLGFAWSSITFPDQGFTLYQLKNPKVLASTLLWFSNGGRHYAPWNGRHRRVIGLEEVTAYFHLGLRGCVMPNLAQDAGIPTYQAFNSGETLQVNTVFGVVETPPEFDGVARVVEAGSGIVLVSHSGEHVAARADVDFVRY
ncbi:MAG: hypothetical protein KF884_06390 [Fimbriimonadaceae bacterium]|nr:hypothetical protein [Fimbriimonadaceae bacterium]QYK57178.1 MAG: hypothetical protein KF884_06390 [Fimbriimonadaceae bacterium]